MKLGLKICPNDILDDFEMDLVALKTWPPGAVHFSLYGYSKTL
jgi:hypothetical protein